MKSLYEELSGKIEESPSLRNRSGPRQDLGLLLFAEREAINELWGAADRLIHGQAQDQEELRIAVERLARLFGPR